MSGERQPSCSSARPSAVRTARVECVRFSMRIEFVRNTENAAHLQPVVVVVVGGHSAQ